MSKLTRREALFGAVAAGVLGAKPVTLAAAPGEPKAVRRAAAPMPLKIHSIAFMEPGDRIQVIFTELASAGTGWR